MLAQSVLDALPVGIMMTDEGLVLTGLNRWLREQLGPVSENLTGRPLGDAFPELAERGLLSAYARVLQSGQPHVISPLLHRYFLRLPAAKGSPWPEMSQSATIIALRENNRTMGTLTLMEDASARFEAERDLQHELDKLETLREIDHVLTTLDLDACLQRIVEQTRAFFSAHSTALFLRETKGLRLAAHAALEGPTGFVDPPSNQEIAASAITECRSVLVADLRADDRFQGSAGIVRSVMAAPLMTLEKCIGSVFVEGDRVGCFTRDDLRLLESITARASSAIYNARLHSAARAEHALSETLRDSILALASELDPDAVLDRLLDHVGRVVPYDSACVMVTEDGELRIKRRRSRDQSGGADSSREILVQRSDIPPLQQMMETGRPVVVSDARTELSGAAFQSSRDIGSWAGAPILVRGKLLGILSLVKTEPHFYADETVQPLATFAAQAGMALENARMYAAQQRLAVTDGLTGVANRRHFDEELAREISRTIRYNTPTSLIMIDVDNFKMFNDNFGHSAGDQLLKNLAAILRETVRTLDIPARYGGEEFALILPQTPIEGAFLTAERLRGRVEAELVTLLDKSDSNAVSTNAQSGPTPPVTISVGLAVAPLHATSPETLIEAADAALYQAKRTGKNRVLISQHKPRNG